MKKGYIEPEEKPNERQPAISCPRTDCINNLFNYCQTAPNLEQVDGRPNLLSCIVFRVRR